MMQVSTSRHKFALHAATRGRILFADPEFATNSSAKLWLPKLNSHPLLDFSRITLPAPRVAMILSIERKQLPHDVVVFEMTGRIILGNNSRDVELNLTKALNDNLRKVIFDLAGITVLDSTGVGIVVMCHAKLKKLGGELRVAGATGIVDETLRMTSVDKIVRFFPTVTAAAADF